MSSADATRASAVRTLYQHEYAVEALLRAGNDRARSTGKEPAPIRSQPELDGNRQLDRLTVKQARPGQGAPTGPIYLSRDNMDLGPDCIVARQSRVCQQHNR